MRISILLLFIFSIVSCVSLDDRLIQGTWCLEDGRTIEVREKIIIFEGNNNDYIEYTLTSDSIAKFKTENNSLWSGKLLHLSRDSIIYYDSIVERSLVLKKCP